MHYENHYSAKKIEFCTLSKWRANNRYVFRVISILTNILKTTFPKEFFSEFWLIIRQHEYIYIAEIKMENFYFRAILGVKCFFRMVKNANFCKTTTGSILKKISRQKKRIQ